MHMIVLAVYQNFISMFHWHCRRTEPVESGFRWITCCVVILFAHRSLCLPFCVSTVLRFCHSSCSLFSVFTAFCVHRFLCSLIFVFPFPCCSPIPCVIHSMCPPFHACLPLSVFTIIGCVHIHSCLCSMMLTPLYFARQTTAHQTASDHSTRWQ